MIKLLSRSYLIFCIHKLLLFQFIAHIKIDLLLKRVNFKLMFKKGRKMKYMIIILMLVSTSLCFGQKKEVKKTIEEKSFEMAEELKKELKLSDEQFIKAKLIYVDYLTQKEELSNKIKLLEKQKKELKSIRNSKVKEILNTEQKNKIELQKAKKQKKSKKN